MDRNKFNSKLLDIKNLLDEIWDWVDWVYDENFTQFQENRDLVRELNECRIYFILLFILGLLLWFLFGKLF